jgi:hypothetical protein
MRDTIVALFIWGLAFVLLAADMLPRPEAAPVPAWTLCALTCQKTEPWDRGQGCIDMECNPLLTPQFEENDR